MFSSALYHPLLTSLSFSYEPDRVISKILQSGFISNDYLMCLISQDQESEEFCAKSFLAKKSPVKRILSQSKRKGGVHPAPYKARCVYGELKLIQQPVLSHIRLSNYKAVSDISLNRLKRETQGIFYC